MLRIISANLNGIRSAAKKGFFDWMGKQDADMVCVQELKAQAADMTEAFLAPHGYHGYFHYAEKKGYSGVGLYTRHKPERVITGFGNAEFDSEGRYVEVQYPHLAVISVYVPSGSSSEERQLAKYRFMEAFLPHLLQLKASGREIVLCGDVNIAHKEIDIKNWKGNLKNSGFLPEERAWIGELFDVHGYVDVFRKLDPRPEQYTWWSNRGQAYAKNVGWRIDYHLATPKIADTAKACSIYKDEKFSDHAPLSIDYDFPL
ncbi:exodeoxyribonuclease III [Cupriavidus gilardii]|jgi:exodeoxyribonuclease III|uniref:Exodeoxyribonuclease III n=2 Tax=Cupriavidus TaxID=106589 RepID=A0A6N1BMJ8_9BURK|nr:MULTISPECIES: exodeoxyribonuclease III [Cupriavidus]ALD89387.1 exodeoxyribonuclease III [Cupriavidus gilardii CR3]QQE07055.1 exodeoxyribonuclease III [Cupriavidus sp. ISTL7]KAA6127042.1 exodeoxyribonuclease III [Cupriavidus cauae]KAB0596693.1 exodeoxyribonuclease III [Cupriavidus gilardii]MCA7085024.1 exodeoxyribonuclease III [Cupriavidus sp. DB3]